MSEDGHLAPLDLSLDPSDEVHPGPTIGDVRKAVEQDLAGTSARHDLAGHARPARKDGVAARQLRWRAVRHTTEVRRA